MTQDEKKRAAARAAVELVTGGSVIGVGTGSTANHFIDALAARPGIVRAAVASSAASATRLAAAGIDVVDLDEVDALPLYVDSADEATVRGELVKGGGGALTREKIVAAASRRFVCIVDDTKLVERLGAFPLPLEVIPLALSPVERALRARGWDPVRRAGFVTDNGNRILDVHGWHATRPVELELELDHIAGVVTNGLFCRRGADVVLVAHDGGVRRLDCDGDNAAERGG